jgi:hypothetical protein
MADDGVTGRHVQQTKNVTLDTRLDFRFDVTRHHSSLDLRLLWIEPGIRLC